MVSNLQRSMYTLFILSTYMLSRITLVCSAECTEYLTLFEETSCDSTNSTKIKPALINHSTWNISKYEMLAQNVSWGDYPPEDCFMELTCEHVETVCEEPILYLTTKVQHIPSTTESIEEENSTESLMESSTTETALQPKLEHVESTTISVVIETTTVNEEVTIEPECRQFFTYLEVKNCDGGNSTVINPGAIELKTYFNSSMSHSMMGDDPSCPFVPLEYQFVQLICEEVTTECEPLNRTTQPFVKNSTQNYALIAVGAVGAVGVASALTYFGVIKVQEMLQSATYHLP